MVNVRAIRRLLTSNRKLRPTHKSSINIQTGLINSREIPRESKIIIPKAYTKPIGSKEDVLAHIRSVHEIYPLITTTWKGRKFTVASARIYFNPLSNHLAYEINEPQLTNRLKKIVEKTISLLQDRLEIDFSTLNAKKAVYGYIDKKIDEVWNYMKIRLNESDIIKAKYYVFRDTVGLGKIEALMKDPNIEDISCDGVGLPIFIFHRNPLYGQMATNLVFHTKEKLDSFAMKLAQKCGRTISVASPLLDAALPDGSRLQVTYGTDIARKGSNFSIRKFFRVPLTIIDLINYETANPMILAYLWLAIEGQQSLLIAGTTAVGKTTFLNSVCQFIPPAMKIVSIEDTSELQLMHINWTPQVARVGFGPKKYGEVTMFDLLKAAMRQRPDYLIVGEVRGAEANVMFHAMSTGHAALSTLHADTVGAIIDRLTTRPINLPLSLLENLDIIVFLERTKRKGKSVRKVGQVIEIEDYDRNHNQLKTNEAFHWIPADDKFVAKDSHILQKIATKLGWSSHQINDELVRRASVLNWMRDKNVHNLRDVTKIINLYYVDPQKLARMMGG